MVEKSFVEIQGTFLMKIRDNTFNRMIGENVFQHIENFLKVIEADEDEDQNDVADIFKIESNLFNFEIPLCKAFNEFNYLFKIDTNLFTFDIKKAKTYEEYELNNNKTEDLDEPWSDNGVPYQLCDHICEPYRFKNGKTKWPMCSSDIDGFCNGGELPGMDYDTCLDANRDFDKNYGANDVGSTQDNKEEHHDPSRCNIRRFEMIKYSFRDDEEYVAVKEDEYDDGTNTSKEAIHAYQEIFRRMDGHTHRVKKLERKSLT
ncbi:hypothetical protein Tco_1461272 [Tanacetum coccineum]